MQLQLQLLQRQPQYNAFDIVLTRLPSLDSANATTTVLWIFISGWHMLRCSIVRADSDTFVGVVSKMGLALGRWWTQNWSCVCAVSVL